MQTVGLELHVLWLGDLKAHHDVARWTGLIATREVIAHGSDHRQFERTTTADVERISARVVGDLTAVGFVDHVITVVVDAVAADLFHLRIARSIEVVAIRAARAVVVRLAVVIEIARRVDAVFARLVAAVDRARILVVTRGRRRRDAALRRIARLHTVAHQVVATATVVGGAVAVARPQTHIHRTVDAIVAVAVAHARDCAVRHFGARIFFERRGVGSRA